MKDLVNVKLKSSSSPKTTSEKIKQATRELVMISTILIILIRKTIAILVLVT